ncbi:MAG: lytic transglycosylase domain-containing protein [Xanthobacteraceae bacterium]
MRAIIAFALLLAGFSSAAPEPDYMSYLDGNAAAVGGTGATALVEIESSIGRADRLPVPSPRPQPDANPVATVTFDAPAGTDSNSGQGNDVALGDLCNALFSSALDNDLPVPFFANLIWQESRLQDDAVSKKGALGIAQFMPQTAVETGLDNPFDPLQAIPASARFLRELRLEFGNLGFVAAAYNAGAHRVVEWLEHRANLPRETRGYVVRVTGLSVDDWRRMAVNDEALTFVRRLPCRSLPAFASVEEAQTGQVRLQQAKLEQIKQEQANDDKRVAEAAKSRKDAHDRAVAREHGHGKIERHEASHATHDHRRSNREADGRIRARRDKHTSV